MSQRPTLWRGLLVGGLLLLTLLVVYEPALHGGYLWDDDRYVPRPEMQSLDGLRRIWIEPGATWQYYPLTYSAFWLGHRLWDDETLGWHLLNLGLHATATLLVWVVLRDLAVPGALLAAGLFALHPVQVESVAWITELKNTLSGVLYLGALLAHRRFQRDPRRRRGAWALGLALFTAAVLAKSVTASLPAAILVITWWARGRLTWQRDWRPLVPHFAIAVLFGGVTIAFETYVVGATGEAHDLPLADRLLIAGRAPWHYLATLVWPTRLAFIYPRWHLDPADALQWLPLVALVVTLGALWAVRNRLGRGPLAAALFFVGTLTPVLGFVNVYPFLYSFVADHFQYLACLGPIVLVAAGLARAFRHLPGATEPRALVASSALLALLAVLSWRETLAYVDVETLWQTTLLRNPSCAICLNNLGTLARARGDLAGALARYRAAVEADPTLAQHHYNLGNALRRSGDLEGAIASHERAVAIDPDFFPYRNNLANALAAAGRWAEAVPHYERAVALAPTQLGIRTRLAEALVRTGRLADAVAEMREVVRQAPENAAARRMLDQLLALTSAPAAARQNRAR